MIQTAIASPWYMPTPVIYRLMEREYVDRFFKTGELRLSTFEKFSEHPDEDRRDEEEGKGCFWGIAPSNGVAIKAAHNNQALSMSSFGYSATLETFDNFKKDAAIQIFDTTNFAATVSRHIPGFMQGLEAYCYYNDGGILVKISDEYVEQLKKLGGTLRHEDTEGYLKGIITNHLFLKKT